MSLLNIKNKVDILPRKDLIATSKPLEIRQY